MSFGSEFDLSVGGVVLMSAKESAVEAPEDAGVEHAGGGRDGDPRLGGGSGPAVAVATKTAAPQTKPKLLPPFRVLLHNDDVNEFEHVILSIMKLTPLTLEDSVRRTLEAHETGLALLLVTHQERAELYAEQFASLNLTVSIEPQ